MRQKGKSPSRKVTQKDIALAAGVSQPLVSMVLNGGVGEVSQECRERILEIANRLGYQPRQRRSPKQRQKLFALIRPKVLRGHHTEEWIYESYDRFYIDLQHHLETAALSRGHTLMANNDEDIQGITQWLSEWNVDGVFWNATNTKLLQWIRERLPVVQVDRSLIADLDAVLTDHFEMVRLAVGNLYDNGHRRIGYLVNKAHREGSKEFINYRKQLEGYRFAITEHGLTPFEYDFHDFHGWIEQFADEFCADSGVYPTALVGSPIQLLILQKALLKRGVKLPEQLSMVAIDDISACQFLSPQLSAIRSNYQGVAEHAVWLMETRLSQIHQVVRKMEIYPSLVERESVFNISTPEKLSC